MMRTSRAAAWLLVSLSSGDLLAADYARQWPLQLPANDDSLFQVELSEEVYQASIDPLLRDVEIVDGAGNPLPSMLQAPPTPSRSEDNKTFAARWFPIAQPPQRGAAGWRAVIEGDRLTLQSSAETAPESEAEGEAQIETFGEMLIDLGEDSASVRSIRLELVAAERALQTTVNLQSSNDLEAWQTLRPPASVYRLQHQGQSLIRTQIDWPNTPGRYLRLQFAQPIATDLIERVVAEQRSSTLQPLSLSWLELEGKLDTDGSWQFATPGALAVRAWELRPGSEQWIGKLRLDSRPWADAPWVSRAEATYYRIRLNGDWLQSGEVSLGLTRDRLWRLRSEQPLPAPPRLRLAYHPDALVFSSNGAEQIWLVAGSKLGRRIDAPLATAMAAARSQRGDSWRPPAANLGSGSERAGESALTRGSTANRGLKLALWSLLVLAALSLLFMASRLFKEDGSAAS